MFNSYINDMIEYLDNETELVQYANDTIVLTSNSSMEDVKKILEMETQKLIIFFPIKWVKSQWLYNIIH